MSQNKSAKGGAAAKGKKSTKGGSEDKREDVLQAVIIADSFQDRFKPFSIEKPRCLLPLANTPLIEYTLELLAMNGVQEVFIYCGAHHEKIENYIHDSKWAPTSRTCPFTALEFIRVSDARSIGDFLRDLDKRSLIESDFILVHGDTVANLSLDSALAAHRARREANRDSIMTMVLREGGEGEHRSKANGITPVFVNDPSQKRCLHYEEINPLQSDHYVNLDPSLLKNRQLEIRTDLIDAQIDICTPDVLALWSESFDYELPRANFLHGTLKDWELNGKMIHTEIVPEGYSARASNLQLYEAISRDVLSGWAYPFTADANLLNTQSYRLEANNVYAEDDVVTEENTITSDCVLGKGTHIGAESTIRNSMLGRNCKIGKGVRITDSFIWDDVTIADGAVIDHAVLADSISVGAKAAIAAGSLLSFGVKIGDGVLVPTATALSLVSAESDPVQPDASAVGATGKGAVFTDPEVDELDEQDPSRLQRSLIYSLEGYNISTYSISTLADEDDFGVDDGDSDGVSLPTDPTSRSRLSSFASDGSDSRSSAAFHSEAVLSLLEALRSSTGGDFDAEKLEFTALRLANDASDHAVRRAIATAFVRRAAELLNGDSGALDPSKAAKAVLSSRKGAADFIKDVAVASDAVEDQVEFILALQKACVSSSRVIEVVRAGNLLAGLLQQMYDADVLEEEGVLGWWEDERGKDGETMTAVREKVLSLVEWFENAEEESEEEDDDDDDDE